jgi:hypothetical protein
MHTTPTPNQPFSLPQHTARSTLRSTSRQPRKTVGQFRVGRLFREPLLVGFLVEKSVEIVGDFPIAFNLRSKSQKKHGL